MSFLIMGVVNLSPDSFSGDGFVDVESAVRRAFLLAESGADIVELGAESSRPGALHVDEKTEWQRLEPLLLALQGKLRLCVDTRKPGIMERSAGFGVEFVNNIEGLSEPSCLRNLARLGLSYLAMHKHGEFGLMQENPLAAGAAVSQVEEFLARSYGELRACGFSHERIWLDPGIGFGKTDPANLRLLQSCWRWSKDYALAIGVSRKSWIGRCFGVASPEDRDPLSKMAEIMLALAGVGLVRTHDVASLATLRRLLQEEVIPCP